jgi:4-hydroxy-L-threonine phosphate dehydrogenase PdxA
MSVFLAGEGRAYRAATPAHGTAFDIQGQGKAYIGATQKVFDIVTCMTTERVD